MRAARDDASGAATQARSINGHLVYGRPGPIAYGCRLPACGHMPHCIRLQARSVNGHLVYGRAGFAAPQVTAVLRRAVAEHGRRGWWELS